MAHLPKPREDRAVSYIESALRSYVIRHDGSFPHSLDLLAIGVPEGMVERVMSKRMFKEVRYLRPSPTSTADSVVMYFLTADDMVLWVVFKDFDWQYIERNEAGEFISPRNGEVINIPTGRGSRVRGS